MADCSPLPLGGYDCSFKESPPKYFECPICLLTMRSPHLISCCGVKICQSCIDSVKDKKSPCPKCRASDFITLLDKEMERAILGLMVYCQMRDDGCQWEGQLRHLDDHMSGEEGGECLYMEVVCSHGCGTKSLRMYMLKHETEECTKLPVEVQMRHFQEKMTKSLDDIRTQHEAEILALKSKITQQDQLILELKANIEASAKAGSLSECITYSGLKRSPLELMPKLLSGCIPGVHYYASRGRVEIYGCCEDEVVARGYCFQLEYQKVVLACRFKTVKLKPFTNSDDLGSFLIELNRKYDSSYLFRTKLDGADVVKIVSTDVSQCDDAVKVLTAKMDSFQCYKMNIGNGRKIVLKMGDICQEDVDVICTTANKHLDVGSKAVGYALNQATRGDLQKICNNYISVNGTLEMGDVAVTSSGGGLLKAKHIIHIVNPTAPRNAEALLSQGVSNAIAAAIKLKATSIAIPALSAGSMLTNDDGLCSMVIKTISEYPYPSECKSLKDIRIIVIGAKVFASFVKCFN